MYYPARVGERMRKEIFFVLVPEVAVMTPTEIELDMTYRETRRGKSVERNLYRKVLVGLPVSKIAEIIEDGMAVDVKDRKEIIRMFKLCDEFISVYNDGSTMVNSGPADEDTYVKIFNFATMLLNQQKTLLSQRTFRLEKTAENLGLIVPGVTNKLKKDYQTHETRTVQPVQVSLL